MSDEAASRKAAAEAALAEANARKAQAEADLAEVTTRKAALAAALPDLSGLRESTLQSGTATQPVAGTGLGLGSVEAAATVVAEAIRNTTGHYRILVTSEPDLATATATAHEISRTIDLLNREAARLLQPDPTLDDRQLKVASAVAGVAIEAAAALAPHVLSLLSAQRTISSGTTSPSDFAAVAAVAGALRRLPNFNERVFIDDLRLTTLGSLQEPLQNLDDHLQRLVARKATLPAGDTAPAHTKAARNQIDALITRIDTFNATSLSVPPGAKRSPLATAALYEPLLDTTSSTRVSHILLVKAQPGSWSQLEDNRPLMLDDRLYQVVEANIVYSYIQVSDSQVIASGIASAIRSATARVGDTITVT